MRNSAEKRTFRERKIMRTKRIFALICAGAMLFALPACRKISLPDSSTDASSEEDTSVYVETGKGTDADDSDDADIAEDDGDALENAGGEVIDLGGATLIDNDDVTITLKELRLNTDFDSMVLTMNVENKTDTKIVMTSLEDSLNGLQVSSGMYQEITAGKSSIVSDEWYSAEVQYVDQSEITDIALGLWIFTADDSDDSGESENLLEQTVHIYPYGEDQAAVYDRELQDTDTELYSDGDITVYSLGLSEDDLWGQIHEVYIVNNSDKNIYVSAEDVSINDKMLDPYWACTVEAGNRAYSKMFWDETSFEENSIESVEKLEFTLEITDYETFDELGSKDVLISVN